MALTTPTQPTGFQDVISLISMAGQANSVSRHEWLVAPTAIRFGRGNNIPHGMKFAAKGKVHDDSSGEESDQSEPSNDPDLSMDESRGCVMICQSPHSFPFLFSHPLS